MRLAVTIATATSLSRRLAEILAGQRALDQAHDIVAAVELDEGAHARALLAAQQHLVERLEPLAQLGLGEVALARLVDLVLDELRALAPRAACARCRRDPAAPSRSLPASAAGTSSRPSRSPGSRPPRPTAAGRDRARSPASRPARSGAGTATARPCSSVCATLARLSSMPKLTPAARVGRAPRRHGCARPRSPAPWPAPRPAASRSPRDNRRRRAG